MLLKVFQIQSKKSSQRLTRVSIRRLLKTVKTEPMHAKLLMKSPLRWRKKATDLSRQCGAETKNVRIKSRKSQALAHVVSPLSRKIFQTLVCAAAKKHNIWYIGVKLIDFDQKIRHFFVHNLHKNGFLGIFSVLHIAKT